MPYLANHVSAETYFKIFKRGNTAQHLVHEYIVNLLKIFLHIMETWR